MYLSRKSFGEVGQTGDLLIFSQAIMAFTVEKLASMLELGSKGQRLLARFQDRFPGPGSREVCFGFVPGRIEVLGRHTDYAGGRSLVCAMDKGFSFVAAAVKGGTVRLGQESAEFAPVEFPLTSDLAPVAGHWSNYPMTMARRIARNFGASGLQGVDIFFESSLPIGSGMSGSSALMMMTFTAIAAINRLSERPAFRANIATPMDLAVYLACAENGQGWKGLSGDTGVGTFGGSEDHAAILMGRPRQLSLFGFRPASLQRELAWPPGWRLAVAFSGVRAEKTREALEKYNMASRRAAAAVAGYNRGRGTSFSTLREVADHVGLVTDASWRRAGTGLAFLDGGAGAGADAGAEAPGLADRVRQFVMDDRGHIPRAITALERRDLPGFGQQISASHRASRRFLWNIVPEIDWLQKQAIRLGSAGASGFGAGFGGSIFAVVPQGSARSFLAAWREGYLRRWPEREAEASFFLTEPGPGIQVWGADGPSRLQDLWFQA
jgi:galactokinase